MAPSSTQFIDAALSCDTAPFILSYPDPKQKWLIRKHLLALIQEFPNLTPSTEIFAHDNGTIVNLLNASGYIHVSHSPPIPITIWLHENYPYMAPIVFVVSNPTTYPIHHGHPFVEPSGLTTSPYLQTWEYPRCNLSELVHKLVQIFYHDHPFFHSDFSSFTHPSLVSKLEALDRISGTLHYDLLALQAKTVEEIEELSTLQVEMVKRVDITTSIIIGLEHEKMNLSRRVRDLTDEADVLMNWLKVHGCKPVLQGHEIGNEFEGADEESTVVIDYLAADRGLEDLIYALDKAVEDGVVSFEMYIRQVRVLAREQYFHRAMLVKLKGPNILNWPN